MEKKKTGLGTAGLVLGIVSIVLAFIPIVNYVSYVLGVLAFIFGLISLIKKNAKVRSVFAVVLAVASIIVTVSMQKAVVDTFEDIGNDLNSALSELDQEMNLITGEATDEILEKHLNVTIGKFTVEDNDFLPETKLDVKLKNISDSTQSFSVMIEAVDKNGARITYDNVYATSLGAGQEQSLEAFVLLDSDTANKLKNATFKIVEVSMY